MDSKKIGRIQILMSGLAFGGLGIFAKAAYHAGIDSISVLTLRFVLATLMMGVLVAAFARSQFKLPRRCILQALTLGALGYAAFASCFFKSLETLGASITVLLLYLYPTIVTVGGALFLREHPRRIQWLALPLSFVGLALLMNSPHLSFHEPGVLWGIASAILYALYILASRRALENAPPFGFSFFVHLGAAVTLLLYSLASGQFWHLQHSFLQAPLPLLALALIPTVVAVSLFLLGLQHIQGHEASLLSTTEPLSAIILARIFLGESMSPAQLLGASIIGTSVILPHIQFKRLFDFS